MHPKLLVANRGEIACRILRAAKQLAIPTVAVYSEADQDLPHVELADEAVRIGPASPRESYLREESVLEAASVTGANLVHPGYGFLSERSSFAERCHQAGLTFVGPAPDTIRLMGDKDRARQAAVDAGVPVLPGTNRLELTDLDGVRQGADQVGYPLLVKAAAGGGGIGMRTVRSATDLADAVRATSTIASKAFGDGTVFLERQITQARHIEVQVFGFGDGTSVHLHERDCSVQRRHQKVIEEARAPRLSENMRDRLAGAAVRLANYCRYRGAGTVEFLYDESREEFFFLEMNTRLQVEHAVTEMVTGVDLVHAQLRFAMGEPMGRELAPSGTPPMAHAIEARIYAEDPSRNHLPRPGPIVELRLPVLEDVRVDCGYRQGNAITHYYDPLVMKIIGAGRDRLSAVDRLRQALSELTIAGITTNVPYLLSILEHQQFLDGKATTSFLTERHDELLSKVRTPA